MLDQLVKAREALIEEYGSLISILETTDKNNPGYYQRYYDVENKSQELRIITSQINKITI